MVPKLALVYIPLLLQQVGTYWPSMATPSALGAQVEQETCISLKSSKCWSPYAELRTSRERGVGFGQFTKTAKFDAIAEIKAQYPKDFAGWGWQNPYQAEYQMRGLVIKDRDLFRSFNFAANDTERFAMALSAYNGGRGGVLQDRRLCANTAGCDPSRWFGHIERTSFKARTTVSGYGKSFFAINREYVRNVLINRRDKYVPLMDGKAQS